jgi:hypothetical protein
MKIALALAMLVFVRHDGVTMSPSCRCVKSPDPKVWKHSCIFPSSRPPGKYYMCEETKKGRGEVTCTK